MKKHHLPRALLTAWVLTFSRLAAVHVNGEIEGSSTPAGGARNTQGRGLQSSLMDRLAIQPASLLPEYEKKMLLRWTLAGEGRMQWDNFIVADFNRDGRPDVAVQETVIPGPPNGDSELGIYLQNADGSLSKKGIVRIGASCTLRLFAQDYNDDGNLDILANESGVDMILAPGNGDGTFQDGVFLGLAAGYYPAVGHLNGDRHLDLAIGATDGGTVTIFVGVGDGTFVRGSTFDAAIWPDSCNRAAGGIFIGDIDRDGNSDVAVASPENTTTWVGDLHVFPGKGDGSFGKAIRTANVAAFRAQLGDFNGDGFLDYAADRYNPMQLEIWLGNGDGRFLRKGAYSLSGIDPVVVSVLDLNGDGLADVTVSGEPPNGCCQTPLSVFLSKGDGTLGARQQYTAVDGLLPLNTAPQLVDFNGDQRPDLITQAWKSSDTGITIGYSKGAKPSPSAGFQLTLQTATPGTAILDVTSDLLNWTSIATNKLSGDRWSIVDSAIGQGPRFYRSRRP